MHAREDGTFEASVTEHPLKETTSASLQNLMGEAGPRLGDGSIGMAVQGAEFGHEQQLGPRWAGRRGEEGRR